MFCLALPTLTQRRHVLSLPLALSHNTKAMDSPLLTTTASPLTTSSHRQDGVSRTVLHLCVCVCVCMCVHVTVKVKQNTAAGGVECFFGISDSSKVGFASLIYWYIMNLMD